MEYHIFKKKSVKNGKAKINLDYLPFFRTFDFVESTLVRQ